MSSTPNIDLDLIQWPQSIRGINDLEREVKEAMYRTLIPDGLLQHFGIDPYDPELLRIFSPPDTRSVEMAAYVHPTDQDPLFYLHMADTLNHQIALLLLVINDPASPRFNVDVDERGLPTRFGTLRRNIPEEIRAMKAGLAPGQVRRGLRLSHQAIPTFERFVTRTGHDLVIIEPLYYHNAVVYERYGFAYVQGRKRMEWIDQVLRPGGEYFDRLDGSTPFRDAKNWQSVRSRSWAVHDGVLGEPFGDIHMYKRVDHEAGVNTFLDGVW